MGQVRKVCDLFKRLCIYIEKSSLKVVDLMDSVDGSNVDTIRKNTVNQGDLV